MASTSRQAALGSVFCDAWQQTQASACVRLVPGVSAAELRAAVPASLGEALAATLGLPGTVCFSSIAFFFLCGGWGRLRVDEEWVWDWLPPIPGHCSLSLMPVTGQLFLPRRMRWDGRRPLGHGVEVQARAAG